MSDDPPLNQKRCPKCQRSYSANERTCPADGEPLSFPDPYHLINTVLADRYRLDALVGVGRVRLKIVDFGIAKAVTDITQTARSIVIGTPSYASPEHLAGGIVDARSDIYSLGVMLFRMLTGALPFDASSIEDLVRLKRGGVRVGVRQLRPEVPLVIDQLVDRAGVRSVLRAVGRAAPMVCDLGILGSGVQRNGCRVRQRPFGVSSQSWLRRGTGMSAHRAYRVV